MSRSVIAALVVSALAACSPSQHVPSPQAVEQRVTQTCDSPLPRP